MRPALIRSKLGYLKRSARNQIRLVRNWVYDARRFSRYASPFRIFRTRTQRQAYITMLYHSLEKGLALPQPRPGFGSKKAEMLLEQLETYLPEYGSDVLVTAAIRSLESYIIHGCTAGTDVESIRERLCALKHRYGSILDAAAGGGVRDVSREEIWAAGKIDLHGFFQYRFSVRQFAPGPVSDGLLRDAICMAQKAPSVCNRQSGRVYVFENDDLGKEVLGCQQGNLGFGHQANKILIVTSELGSFLSVGERNQSWIDGGLFAMALLFALHSLGLGACPLNWSVERETDERLREIAGIRHSENVIMMIAVGHLPERLTVAYSQRKPLDEIARFHTVESEHEQPATASIPA